MKPFQRALSDSQLGDLGFVGPKFTWCDGRGGRDFTKERLDRAVANVEWCSIFNVVEVAVLANSCSDHNPLLVSFSHTNDAVWQKNKIFRRKLLKRCGGQKKIMRIHGWIFRGI